MGGMASNSLQVSAVDRTNHAAKCIAVVIWSMACCLLEALPHATVHKHPAGQTCTAAVLLLPEQPAHHQLGACGIIVGQLNVLIVHCVPLQTPPVCLLVTTPRPTTASAPPWRAKWL